MAVDRGVHLARAQKYPPQYGFLILENINISMKSECKSCYSFLVLTLQKIKQSNKGTEVFKSRGILLTDRPNAYGVKCCFSHHTLNIGGEGKSAHVLFDSLYVEKKKNK